MKCPLFFAAAMLKPDVYSEDALECIKEDCAGWDSVGQTCVAISIYQELRLLVGAVSMLADKLPTPPTIKR
ncbi:hypothetical protein ES703_92056 [subsurface metagenome]